MATDDSEEGGGGAGPGKPAARRGSANDAPSSADGGAGDASSQKCTKCKKRLGRRNCPHQACVQCCADPSCEPHRDARAALKKEKAMLDGTDWITRTAAQKRACKVGEGAFRDPAIRYFGETVVIWNVHDFLRNSKWREDAMRRSRHRKGGDVDLDAAGRRKRKRKGEDEAQGGGVGMDNEEKKTARPMSRKRRFRMVMDRLYRESLVEGGAK